MRHSVARTGVGGGPLRSESARLPGVTLALAAPGPPVQLRWTTLRVQGPTLRDAALANGGNGSPPVAPRLLPPALRTKCSQPHSFVNPQSCDNNHSYD